MANEKKAPIKAEPLLMVTDDQTGLRAGLSGPSLARLDPLFAQEVARALGALVGMVRVHLAGQGPPVDGPRVVVPR